MVRKVNKITEEIKPILTEFLSDSDYFELFKSKARELGYTGDDIEKIKIALFTPDENGEICFADGEIYNAFIDFQIMYNIKDIEPYKTLLKERPEVKSELIAISRDILDGKDVDSDRVLNLFPKSDDNNTRYD